MKIIEKIRKRNDDAHGNPMPTIVMFGSSSTEGCFEVHTDGNGKIITMRDRKHSIHRYLSDMLFELYPCADVTFVNSGIAGDTTEGAIKRLERDVISKNPDLVIMSIGGNDCTEHGLSKLDEYGENLKYILTKIKETGAEIIFWTPYAMCTRVKPELTDPLLREIAEKVASAVNAGIYDMYIERAKTIAKEHGAHVCDIRAIWKNMQANGVDTDLLLSNHINHATREFNKVIAANILEAMMED